MSSLDKSLTPEERLRLLLTDAVEPVQPGPGAEARLQAKIRAGRRERDLPKRLRWAGAALGAAAVVAGGVLVVSQTGRDDGSSASSATSATSERTPASGPSSPGDASGAASGASSGALSYGSNAPVPAAAASPPTADLGKATTEQQSGAGSVAGAPQLSGGVAGAKSAPLSPLAASAFAPSDLNGDNSSDQLTLSGQRLVVTFRGSTQSVTLPQVSAAARVLGVTQLKNAAGASVPVAFIRLGADSAHARDTLVAVVAGKLTVLRLDGQPVVLAVTATQGYTCDGALVVTAAKVTGYTVDGADLIPTGSAGIVAKPGSNCSFS
jgi:hypothetical protein